jgi:hypothetical protein
MMSNNSILAPVINSNLPVEEMFADYSSGCGKLEKIAANVQQVLQRLISHLASNIPTCSEESIVHVQNRQMSMICSWQSLFAEKPSPDNLPRPKFIKS